MDVPVEASNPNTSALKTCVSQDETSKLQSKFETSGLNFKFGFASLETYFGGLERFIGTPSPAISAAMEQEHESVEPYNSHNVYKTSPRLEWLYVTTQEVI